MHKINLLDIETANKIAAGEVINRPASIVKELIENAIDAKSTFIYIEVKDGGINYINIRDNGIGIPVDQVSLAFKRHATSKIKSMKDLFNVKTYGFRGEALPSIAAVSKVCCVTKTSDSKIGIKYIIEGGKEKSSEEIACATGTQISVSDIFYNVLPRRRHLKSVTREAGHIAQVVTSMALGNPHIHFKYYHNNNLVLQSAGTGKLSDSIITIMGLEFFKSLFPLNYNYNKTISINGYISKPQYTRASRSNYYYYVNNRWIYSQFLNKVIDKAYTTLIPSNRYPIIILNINIPYNTVDVNVHPTKREIKFDNEQLLEDIILKTFKSVLKSKDSIKTQSKNNFKPTISEQIKINWLPVDKNPIINKVNKLNEVNEVSEINVQENNTIYKTNKIEKSHKYNNEQNYEQINEYNNAQSNQIAQGNEIINKNNFDNDKDNFFLKLKPLIQIDASYIIAKIDEEKGFYILDQHAAHERINYEQLLKNMECSTSNSQLLLEPYTINFTPMEREFIIENMLVLKDSGFIIEYFGDNTFLLRSIPMGISITDAIKLIKDLLDKSYINKEKKLNKNAVLKMIACKSSVTAKNKMNDIEMNELLRKLSGCSFPYTCPHGRPTIIHISEKELIKRFNR
jgi:DNA mismatch repair protein MutL